MGRGRPTKQQEFKIHAIKRECIKNLYSYFCRNSKKSFPVSKTSVYRKVAEALQLSYSSVYRTLNSIGEESGMKNNNYKNKLDDFDKQLIRRTVFKFYKDKTFPTVPMVLNSLKDVISMRYFIFL